MDMLCTNSIAETEEGKSNGDRAPWKLGDSVATPTANTVGCLRVVVKVT